MLEELPIENVSTDVVRLASYRDADQFLEDQEFDESSVDEVMRFLESRGIATKPRDLVDQVFKRKHQLERTIHSTRFSDGSFPVLYGAIEVQTAEAEVKHWFGKYAGAPAGARTASYMHFTFRFNGGVKDLRRKQADWPELTHDTDYGFCNNLGAEAAATGLDGLLAPSARNEGGTNLPAFARQAVGDFSEGELVAVTYDPRTGETSVREV